MMWRWRWWWWRYMIMFLLMLPILIVCIYQGIFLNIPFPTLYDKLEGRILLGDKK